MSGALVLYGRNPIREALRARRRPVHRVWATRGAAAEPWLRDVEVIEARPEEITARTGAEAHQGRGCVDQPVAGLMLGVGAETERSAGRGQRLPGIAVRLHGRQRRGERQVA